MSRTFTRILLGIALLLAGTVLWIALTEAEGDVVALGSTIAASLAVVTAVISSWGAQRVVEIEEDKQKPNVILSLDFSSRYLLVLFRVENSGGSSAFNIEISWDNPLKNPQGEEVRFSPAEKAVQIPVLIAGAHISKSVGVTNEFFKSASEHIYTGKVTFNDASNKKYSSHFLIDADVYRSTPTYSEEALKTHHTLQKLPSKLDKLQKELGSIQKAIQAITIPPLNPKDDNNANG